MRLVTVVSEDEFSGGILRSDGTITALKHWGFQRVDDFVSGGATAWKFVHAEHADAPADWPADSQLGPAITRPPRNLFCIGLNYQTHYDEGVRKAAMPEFPVIFTKAATTLIGPRADIVVDRSATDKVDWEAELAVVIGLGGRNIDEADAMDHVFGYCLANDVSARDLQQANGPYSQWHKGKSLDGFCPLGPFVACMDDLPDLEALRLRLTVNGEVKQDFRPAEMYHSIPRLIAYLSRGMTLLPGDTILTGTAAGVGLWQDPPQFLHSGDIVDVTCPGLGHLHNRVVDESGGSHGGS